MLYQQAQYMFTTEELKKVYVVIPARLKSTRLPGKPLILLNDVPMVIRVYRQCLKVVPEDKVCIATDSLEILDVCRLWGANAAMTSQTCLTGTDRVAEIAKNRSESVFINVQGDEPVFSEHDLAALIQAALKRPNDVINGYCEITSQEEYLSPSIPKVVMSAKNKKLFYMSRAAIPSGKAAKFNPSYRQVCAYAFPRAALMGFVMYGRKTPLEELEDIEILRFLELGYEVKMIQMSNQSISVDNPGDIKKAELAIAKLGL